ncbi:hypothetical protein [Cellulomonas sp. KRMCY2]|uniref:hypothetical protein n=1 Tax=Cellulomonas sp. KRMCY2 TaxID=1304865 RepID=UPI00045E76C9|nr:hypothetical protein [Cellulomonas sp. KRMCY2]
MTAPAQAPAPARRWWQRRAITASLTAVLVGSALIVGALAGAQPAAAGPCDPNQTLAPIAGTGTAGVTNQLLDVDGYAVVTSAGGREGYPAGLGLTFSSFGLTPCGDALQSGAVGTAKVLWDVFALLPLRFLGLILDFSLGGSLAETLLGFAQGLVTALQQHVFVAWAPLVITLALITVILGIARGRGQKGWGDLAWMLIVIAIAGIFATPTGIGLAQTANRATAQLTRCAALAPSGGCESGSISDSVLEVLVGDTWAAGVLGELGAQPAPSSLHFTADGGVPDISQAWDVTVPVQAIPARVENQPTWGEVWRWTGAYTAAESSRILSAPDARCSISGSSPETIDISNPDFADLEKGELCSYKWVVRTAMLSELATSFPDSYQDARGATSSGMTASLTALGLIPAMVGVAALGIAVLMAEIELILLIVISPVVALFALKDVATGRRWAEKVVATIIRRITTGVVLGLVIFMLAALQQLVAGTLVGAPAGAPVVPVLLRPLAVGLLGVVVAIAGFKLAGQVRDMALSAAGLPEGDGHGDKATGAAKQLGLGAVAAGVGAATAGKGAHFAGAGKALLHNGGGHSLRSAVRTGVHAGRGASRGPVAKATPGDAGDSGDSGGFSRAPGGEAFDQDPQGHVDAGRRTSDAWAKVMEVPQLAEARAASLRAAAAQLAAAKAELTVAEARQVAARDAGQVAATARVEQLVAQGVEPAAAAWQADAELSERLAPTIQLVAAAQERVGAANVRVAAAEQGDGTALAEAVRDAIVAGQSADEVAARHGLDGDARVALRGFEDARRFELRMAYPSDY